MFSFYHQFDIHFSTQEMLRRQEGRILSEMQSECLANERLYSERLSALQHSRELVQIERDALAAERRQLHQGAAFSGISASRSDLTAAANSDYDDGTSGGLMAMLHQFARRPSDEQLQHIDRQLAAARLRCADGRYEFAQRQLPAGLGTYKAVVTIGDRTLDLLAEWPPARLDVWLERPTTTPKTAATATMFEGFEVMWCQRSEYELRCAELEQADGRSSASGGNSGRTSLAGAQRTRIVDAALLRTALANQQQKQQQQQHSEIQAETGKRRLRYDATPDAQKRRSQEMEPPQAENVEPQANAAADSVKRSKKLVRMVVD